MLLSIDILTYCAFFATSFFALDHYFKYRRRANQVLQLQLRAAELQSELAHARLAVLPRGYSFTPTFSLQRLQRHFDHWSGSARNEFAVEMIMQQLGELLRLTMENIDRQELPLARELDFVRSYLNVERVRFGEKLQVDLDIQTDTLGAVVPSLLLQPLVENAIKLLTASPSGSPRGGGAGYGHARRDERLLLAVIDDGPEDAGTENGDGAFWGNSNPDASRGRPGEAFKANERRPAECVRI